MIPYGRQSIDRTDIDAVTKVLGSDWLTQGPKIKEFEDALAEYCGAKYAVAACNGTAALHLAYLAGNLKHGDEVITTPNTFVATSNMLLAVGAKPVFCDIDLSTYNIDESKIESLITKKTKAIVPVHFAGHPCDMDKILKIAKKYKLLVIEDACHALGAEYKDKKIGSIGDMTIFSFHPVKSITTGEGGAILTNNETLYKKLISLRSHGIHKDENGFNVMTEFGYNYRLTDLQASLGTSQLKKLDKFIRSRRKIVSLYKKGLANIKGLGLPAISEGSSWHIYVIRAENSKIRAALAEYLKKAGIGINFHYPSVYSHPYYRKNGYGKIKLSNEEIYQGTCITLPIYPSMTAQNVKYVSNKIKTFLK